MSCSLEAAIVEPKPRFIVLTIMARIVRSLAPLATIVVVLVSCISPPITLVASPTVSPPAAIEATPAVTATLTAGLPDSTLTPSSTATQTPQDAREAEAYAVYSAVIQTRYVDTQQDPELKEHLSVAFVRNVTL